MKIRLLVWANKGKKTSPFSASYIEAFLTHDGEVEIPPAMAIAYGIRDPDAKEQVITYVHGVMFEQGFDRNSEHMMIAMDEGFDSNGAPFYSAPLSLIWRTLPATCED